MAGIAAAVAIAVLLVFAPVRHNEFLNWDDQSYVTQNDHVRGGVTWDGIVWAFTSSHSANWHPLTWISHMLDCQLYNLQPGGHHITNVLIHSINAAVLFLLLWMLTHSTGRSVLVAVLFAFHPLRVESVAWLSERKDVLSLFFGLLALVAYARFTQSNIKNAKCKTPWYVAALILFAMGLMSKPMLVTWPFVMLLLDFWPLNRIQSSSCQFATLKPLLLEKLPFFALAAISCVVTVLAQQRGGAVASFEHLPLGLRLENAVVAYVEYLARFFWPGNLSPIYPHPTVLPGWKWAGAAALIVALTVGAWQLRRRSPYVLTGWLWFLGTLIPVIGVIQVGSQAFADRYTYIPMIGLVTALVWLGGDMVSKLRLPRFVVVSASVALVAILGWRTTIQIAYWKTTETLFRYTLTLSPDNVQALFGLGSHLVEHGQPDEGNQVLERAIRLQPTYVEAIGTLASSLDGQGLYAEAVRRYEEALKLNSNNASVLNNYAWLLASCPDASFRDGQQAVRLASQACEITSWSKPLFIGTLAAAQAEAGDFQTAITTAERAIALATKLHLAETAARNRELIGLYRQGRASHGGTPKS